MRNLRRGCAVCVQAMWARYVPGSLLALHRALPRMRRDTEAGAEKGCDSPEGEEKQVSTRTIAGKYPEESGKPMRIAGNGVVQRDGGFECH